MNPFDLRGPEFLLFYLVFAAVVFVFLYWMRGVGGKEASKPQIEDPYLVAFLRGGASEALRVATLSLMDRGLLAIRSSGSSTPFSVEAENRLEMTTPKAIESARRPIESKSWKRSRNPNALARLWRIWNAAPHAANTKSSWNKPGCGTRRNHEMRFSFVRRLRCTFC